MKLKNLITLGILSISILSCVEKPEKEQLNVLMIAVDDMNNWVGAWGGQAKTPNIDQLASEGVQFRNAHCIVPACNPSRVGIMTGQRPETTGQYDNEGWFREMSGGSERITLAQYLRANGYESVAAGKIFHHQRGSGEKANKMSDPISWNYQWKGEHGTPGHELFLDENGHGLWQEHDPSKENKPVHEYLAEFGVWGAIPHTKEECGDWQLSEFCSDYLMEDHEKPFFLSMGIFRPHSPQIVPQEFFDMYPLESIDMHELPEDDMEDIPTIAKTNFSTSFVNLIKEKGELKNAVQGYLASMSFADACVGNVLNALKNSKYADNTVVVFWTDHGWQLAHKDRWEKFSLWNQGTNSPMIVRTPDKKRGEFVPPVSFLDIYPTVVDLLGLDIPSYLEGESLLPYIEDTQLERENPAVVTYPKGNHAVHYKHWNYIHYINGEEELYNHITDPNEYNNIASDPQYKALIEQLKRHIPETTN